MVKWLALFLAMMFLMPSTLGLYQIRCDSTELKPWVEPIEICYIITYTGRVIRVTSGRSDSVWFIPTFEEVIARHGVKLDDVFIIIHNHLVPSGFSTPDVRLYNRLVQRGFVGIYALRTPGDNVLMVYPKKGEVNNE